MERHSGESSLCCMTLPLVGVPDREGTAGFPKSNGATGAAAGNRGDTPATGVTPGMGVMPGAEGTMPGIIPGTGAGAGAGTPGMAPGTTPGITPGIAPGIMGTPETCI